MKTALQIRMDFNQARRRASELEETANDIRNIARKNMEGTLSDLMASWKGDSANQYMAKAERLQNDIEKTASELLSIASTIRTIAKRIYDAEMEALRIALMRSGSSGGDGSGGGGGGSF